LRAGLRAEHLEELDALLGGKSTAVVLLPLERLTPLERAVFVLREMFPETLVRLRARWLSSTPWRCR
jgi:hypothetical protein